MVPLEDWLKGHLAAGGKLESLMRDPWHCDHATAVHPNRAKAMLHRRTAMRKHWELQVTVKLGPSHHFWRAHHHQAEGYLLVPAAL